MFLSSVASLQLSGNVCFRLKSRSYPSLRPLPPRLLQAIPLNSLFSPQFLPLQLCASGHWPNKDPTPSTYTQQGQGEEEAGEAPGAHNLRRHHLQGGVCVRVPSSCGGRWVLSRDRRGPSAGDCGVVGFILGGDRRLPPSSQGLVSIHPPVEEGQCCLHQALYKGQGKKVLCVSKHSSYLSPSRQHSPGSAGPVAVLGPLSCRYR